MSAPLHCDRCRYDMPLDGIRDMADRAEFARQARGSRITAIIWLRREFGYDLVDAKVLANHVTGQSASGECCCYKCGEVAITADKPCPRCGSLMLDW